MAPPLSPSLAFSVILRDLGRRAPGRGDAGTRGRTEPGAAGPRACGAEAAEAAKATGKRRGWSVTTPQAVRRERGGGAPPTPHPRHAPAPASRLPPPPGPRGPLARYAPEGRKEALFPPRPLRLNPRGVIGKSTPLPNHRGPTAWGGLSARPTPGPNSWGWQGSIRGLRRPPLRLQAPPRNRCGHRTLRKGLLRLLCCCYLS